MTTMAKQGAGTSRFQPGQSGNPSGRPKGVKGKIIAEFLKALLEDFAEHGKEAIRTARERSPVQYLRLVASLMPKNWLGDDEEEPSVPVPVVVVARKHEMVRSPHRFR